MSSEKIINPSDIVNSDVAIVSSDTVIEISAKVDATPDAEKAVKTSKKTSKKKSEKTTSKKDKSTKNATSKDDKKDKDATKTSKKKKLVVTKSEKKSEKDNKDVAKKDAEKTQEISLRDKLFPKEFTVHEVKFTRLELAADEKKSCISAFKKAYISDDYADFQFFIAFNWDKELLQRKSKATASVYEQTTHFVPPAEFPNNLDMSLIDAVLTSRADLITSHSVYTEFPGFVSIDVLKKRTKENFFDAYNCPAEIYIADYSHVSENNKYVEGSFINLFADDKEKVEG